MAIICGIRQMIQFLANRLLFRNIWDNACIESFHSLIKREWLNRFKIRDYGHAYRLVFEYLEAFYNTKRIHSHCDYMSPNDYEELYRRVQQHELLMAG